MNALAREIAAMIAQDGPISLELYMKLALTHPLHGYYRNKTPIGAQGDFITAPEVHQMFGELIGLWAVEMWHRMGTPSKLLLVELGPGRGTLMADALRAASIAPGFLNAIEVHLVETSETLRALQHQALVDRGLQMTWHDQWEKLPEGPMIIIANEFFDALPVRHYVFDGRGWCERLVGLAGDGQLSFGLAAEPSSEIQIKGEPGSILERGFAAQAFMSKIATRFSTQLGALLTLDYGSDRFHLGETLQAMRQHRFVHPLDNPGEADLTAHVDFSGLAQAAVKAGALVYGPVSQGAFLTRLGVYERAKQLSLRADAKQRQDIEQALDRLVRPGPVSGPSASMAELFKVLAVTSSQLSVPPGFEADAA